MKAMVSNIRKSARLHLNARKRYKHLRKHLNRQPVGFPSTLTGVEIRLLKEIFTPEEAGAALHLDYRFVPFETVYGRARRHTEYSEEQFRKLLDGMEKKGCVFVRFDNQVKQYALHPFVIGMFEMQIKRLTPGYYLDTRNYVLQGFAVEYLTTKVPQMRVIPVRKSILPEHHIASYDEIRAIVEQAGDRICVTDCICKTGKGMIGEPCRTTDRKEICLGFRDFADIYARHGWGRKISSTEAMAILDQSEKDGLVLIPSTMQEPQFVCSCCRCCCGILEMIGSMPRPADFAASNFYAELDRDACNGCRKCLTRCQIEAIRFDEGKKKAVAVDRKRCIGCGLCVTACKTGALALKKKSDEFTPPRDHDALMELIGRYKKGTATKLIQAARSLLKA